VPGLADRARDVAYTAVGFGVLSAQRAQWGRQQFLRRLRDYGIDLDGDNWRASVSRAVLMIDDAMAPVVDQIDASLLRLQDRLPPPAKDVLHQVRAQARQAGAQLREQIKERAA